MWKPNKIIIYRGIRSLVEKHNTCCCSICCLDNRNSGYLISHHQSWFSKSIVKSSSHSLCVQWIVFRWSVKSHGLKYENLSIYVAYYCRPLCPPIASFSPGPDQDDSYHQQQQESRRRSAQKKLPANKYPGRCILEDAMEHTYVTYVVLPSTHFPLLLLNPVV